VRDGSVSRRASFAFSAVAALACSACAASPAPAARRRDLITLVTSDESVRIQMPVGEGWRCLDRRRKHHEGTRSYSFVYCELQTREGDLSLEFDYMEIEPFDEVPSAEELCKNRYPGMRREEHADARVVAVRPIAHQGRSGCEVTLDATDEIGRPIRILERVFVAGAHILHGTAIATPAFLTAHHADVERWFTGATFAPLE
jgi:hypothetical protein